MPRRVATYDPQFTFWNQFASARFVRFAASRCIIFVGNMFWSIRNGKKAGPNPWGARTLEWMIPSPPPYYNFKNIPSVYGLPYDFGSRCRTTVSMTNSPTTPPALLAGSPLGTE